MSDSLIETIIIGDIQRETIINLAGNISIDQSGGSLIYSSIAYRFWTVGPGLVARIGENTPEVFLSQLENIGMNIKGIHRISSPYESRAFYAMLDEDKFDTENPVGYFGRLKQPFPKILLGYSGLPFQKEIRNQSSPLTLFPEDVPESYWSASMALLGPVDYLSLNMLAPHLRNNSIKTLVIKPSSGTMNPSFWYEFPALVRGCTGLICTQKGALDLFLGKSENLWEIAETIATFGLEFVIITCGAKGQLVYDRLNHSHWQIPAYSIKVIDTVHASDTFAGGFMAGFQKNFDPLKASFYGNIACSIKLEGNGAFYLLDALPGLANARLEVIKEKAIKC
jgi:pfkB family carbohydrate kinase